MLLSVPILVTAVLACLTGSASASDTLVARTTTPKTVVIDGSRLVTARAHLKNGTASTAAKNSYSSLKTAANGWLSQGPWSVLDKGKAGPNTTSINQYYSLAPYFWPSKPKTASNPYGCPYVEKDGQRNPAVDVGTDRQAIGNVCESVPLLALAWWYTGDSRYSTHAASIVRTWFITNSTRMNPNLQNGQVITCADTGRSIGIIDFSQMYTSVLDAVAILQSGAPGWTSSDTAGFKTWNTEYYDWLTNNAFGKEETAETNNHGVFADMQRAALAQFLGQTSTVQSIVKGAETSRINVQIAADGSQPQELARTRSFHYSCFDLVAFTRLAQIGTKVGINLWSYTGSKGQSIFKAVDYIIPAATGAKAWNYPELNFTRYAALDVIHSASDAGHAAAKSAVVSGKLAKPPQGDLWYMRPAPEQLDSIAG